MEITQSLGCQSKQYYSRRIINQDARNADVASSNGNRTVLIFFFFKVFLIALNSYRLKRTDSLSLSSVGHASGGKDDFSSYGLFSLFKKRNRKERKTDKIENNLWKLPICQNISERLSQQLTNIAILIFKAKLIKVGCVNTLNQ